MVPGRMGWPPQAITPATVSIDAGTVTNSTTLELSADGGAASGDSSGGDDTLATTG